MKWFLLIAIMFGVSALILDAFFAHGLKNYLGAAYDETAQHALATASRYQLMAAFFLLILLIMYRVFPSISIVVSQFLVIAGVTFFSGTIYLKYLCGMASLSFLAPLGGISFMLAFLALLPLFFSV